MPFVLDASFAASWFLPDEASPATNALLDRLVEAEAPVPSLFRHEMRNLDAARASARAPVARKIARRRSPSSAPRPFATAALATTTKSSTSR